MMMMIIEMMMINVKMMVMKMNSKNEDVLKEIQMFEMKMGVREMRNRKKTARWLGAWR